jgi:DNA-binding transcriptional MerR regulator
LSLVSIGEFARLSRLSPKALRLYDELGLLVPAEVDAETGYRWYADTQLERARVVASLRRIRVPLARIRDVLAQDPATAAEEIRAYWAGAEAEHAARTGHRIRRAAALNRGAKHRRPPLINPRRTSRADHLSQQRRVTEVESTWLSGSRICKVTVREALPRPLPCTATVTSTVFRPAETDWLSGCGVCWPGWDSHWYETVPAAPLV